MTNKLYLVSILILFATFKSVGQHTLDSLLGKKNPSVSSRSVENIKLVHLYDNRPNYMYNDSKDTITLSSIDSSYGLCTCSLPKIVAEVQIDKKGAKEVVFYRKCHLINEFYRSSFRQTTRTTIKKYDVWNLDSKQLLFEAKSYYKSKFDGIDPNPQKVPRHQKSTKQYQYSFRLNKKGTIQIKHLRGKLKDLVKLKEGSYLFTDGKYVLKE
jgi:hypothetical protein